MTEAYPDDVGAGDAPEPLDRDELEELETIVDAIESVPQVSDVTNVDGTVGVSAEAMQEAGVSAPGGELPGLSLPGFGDGPMQDYCGDRETHFCDECGETFPQQRRCGQSRCPECWESWVINQAETITKKVDTSARTRAARQGDGTAWHKHHVAIMPPQDWRPAGDPQERMQATKEVIKKIIRDAWDAEGVAVYHGWSGSGYGEHEEIAPGVDDRGEWPDRLDPQNREWEGDLKEELHKRPHFHAVVTAPRIEGGQITKRVEEETGWIISRIYDEETNRSISGEKDGPSSDGEMRALASVVTYVLSHGCIDTTGDRNQLQQVRVGSAWHDPTVRATESVELSAKRAVRSVAPTTLGIPENRLKCDELIAPERAPDADEHHTHDHDDGTEDGLEEQHSADQVTEINESAGTLRLGDGTIVDVENPEEYSVGDEVNAEEFDDPRIECQGASRHISEAPQFVSSSTWTDRAQFAHETIRALEERGEPPP